MPVTTRAHAAHPAFYIEDAMSWNREHPEIRTR
jgi:hypothetical protein